LMVQSAIEFTAIYRGDARQATKRSWRRANKVAATR
jgi:hypothetical protein